MKNKLFLGFLTFSLIIFTLFILFYAMLFYVFQMDISHKVIAGVIVACFALAICSLLIFTYFFIKRKREDIKKSFDFYIEKQISASGTGVIIFNNDYDIIWVSKFIDARLNDTIIGKKLDSISDDFTKQFQKRQNKFRFDLGGFIFEAITNIENKTITLKDVTNEEKILKQYISEKLIIGELEIDNFQQFQVSLSEEELFASQTIIVKMLDTLSEQWNFIYKQYVNGKYIFFTNAETLNKMIKDNFSFLDQVRNVKMDSNSLSVSIGIGAGSTTQKILQQLARDGLKQAQARGGDQVALMKINKKPQYFGSNFEIAQAISKVKIKHIASLLEKKLINKKIKNVIIYGHKLADLDSVGSALGLFHLAKSYGKKCLIGNVTFDTTTERTLSNSFSKSELSNFFATHSKISRISKKNTLFIIVDTSEIKRIENPDILEDINLNNVFVFDHHRVSKLPQDIPLANIYIDTSASSASEIISEIIHFMPINAKLDRRIAQMILNGIFLDTSNFTKSVSLRTYQAAGFLESQGASSSIASEIMKLPQEASVFTTKLLENVSEIKPGYFLSVYEGEIPDDIISMAADEILRIQGRKASFVVAKSVKGKNIFKMSARGVETNVQKIAEAVGGGGNFVSAAATSNEQLSIFVDNIRQAIISSKGDE